jgi:serine/threonine-protein phosphatase 2A activator
MASFDTPSYTLNILDNNADHEFKVPVKRINDGDDVSFFLTSKAYTDIMTFIFQLNGAMFPAKIKEETSSREVAREWRLRDVTLSNPPAVVQNLAKLVKELGNIIDETPPDTGPRRFGNISFRKWYATVEERISDLLDQSLPGEILSIASTAEVTAKAELQSYLMGSFGSAQRLDYGTGHELSFLAFLGGLWKLGAFPATEDGSSERFIVLAVIEP